MGEMELLDRVGHTKTWTGLGLSLSPEHDKESTRELSCLQWLPVFCEENREDETELMFVSTSDRSQDVIYPDCPFGTSPPLQKKPSSSTRKAHGTPEFPLPSSLPLSTAPSAPAPNIRLGILGPHCLALSSPAFPRPRHHCSPKADPSGASGIERTEVGQGKPHGVFIPQQNLLCLFLESQQPQTRSTRAEKECLRKLSAGLGHWVGCAFQRVGCAL